MIKNSLPTTNNHYFSTKSKNIVTFYLLFFLIFSFHGKAFSAEDNLNELKNKLKNMEKRLEDLKIKVPEVKKQKKTKKTSSSKLIDKTIDSSTINNYLLLPKNRFSIEYSLEYKGKDFDYIQVAEENGTNIEKESFHNLTNKVTIEYPVKDNVTLMMSMPFVYVYDDKQGSNSNTEDFGDPYLGVLYQPVKETTTIPAIILSMGITAPMGRSPYEINPLTEFPTGEGVYSPSIGVNFSKKFEPAVLYGGINYSYKMEKGNLTYKNYLTLGESGEYLKKVKPGDELGLNFGVGYVISDLVSISLTGQLTFIGEATYQWRGRGEKTSSPKTKSRIFMGTAWQITEKRRVFLDLGIGLSNNEEDFSVEMRLPFNFMH